jgi:hypothetical protein
MMEISNNTTVRPYHVMHLATLGFKVVPLAPDGKGAAAIPWTPIYENGGWNLIELSKNYSLFQHGIATCFGIAILPKTGQSYYLNCLDIDSQNVIDRLKDEIDKSRQKTWVTKSQKGYHVYWFSSTGENAPIRTEDCMPGWEFEIKTDISGGLATLPPSRHRNNPDFIYENIGQPYIGISDEFYAFVVGKLRDKLFAKTDWKPSRSGAQNIPWQSIILTDDEVHEIAGAVSAPNGGYVHGLRHKMSVGLAGFLCKNGVDYESAKTVYLEIIRLTHDEEKYSRLFDLKQTYKRAESEKKIVGFYLLHELNPILAEKLAKIIDNIRDKR